MKWRKTWILLGILFIAEATSADRTGADLQAILDAGDDLILSPGEEVELTETLEVSHEGQAIYTRGAKTVLEYATIRHGEGSTGTLIEGNGIAGLQIHDVILDGNRSGFRQPEGILEMEPMISLGGEGAIGQEIRRCIVINSRSAGGWAAIHMQEGGAEIIVEDNIVFACGADIRGNGRSLYEKPFGWGDGISTASRNTLIRNNLIYDSTDEGIMVQGGPGSRVLDNVIVSVSREMLGGIALIDPFGYYQLDPKESKRYDYREVMVEDNWIIAMGGRIHAGVPLGGAAWHPRLGGTTLYGATVRNNLISGKAGGYGYVANGIDGFSITGNKSDAVYSGRGDGLPSNPPDEPSAFLYNPEAVASTVLQPEFMPAKGHVEKVLRSDRGGRTPSDPLGYRDVGYPVIEAQAVVETAYLEMLCREPSGKELEHWTSWLTATHANSDTLRSILMTSSEFIEHFGYVNPLDMHKWRGDRWLQMMIYACSELQHKSNGQWPMAKDLHMEILKELKFTE